MVTHTGINVNKKNRVEKMTEEQVKALIQELRDEIPNIHMQLHQELDKDVEFHNKMREEREKHYREYVGSKKDLAEQKRLKDSK